MTESDERLRVPPAYAAPCEFCGDLLDVRSVGVCRFTRGWVEQRDGGGGHGVSLPEREPRWAHARCVRRRALVARSPSLFEA